MTRREEQILVEKAQVDPTQFDTLYRAFIDEIYRFIYYKTSSQATAEDLTAQVFMHALEHISRFRYKPGARFSSWLYTIARNQVIDYYRKARPTAALEEVEPIGIPETSSTTVDQQFQQEQIQQLLQQLPKLDQEVLKLRLWQDKPYHEIAQIVRLNAVTVRARFSRALKKFKQLYTDRYGSLH